MPEEEFESFTQAARPLIKWLAENVHPHHTAIVTSTSAELLQGVLSVQKMNDCLRN